MSPRHARTGLTLVEMTITMAIIAILASVVFAALDPPRRLNAARNTRRQVDIATLVDALKAYQADHDGALIHCYDNDGNEVCIDLVPTTENEVLIIGEGGNDASCACPALTGGHIPDMDPNEYLLPLPPPPENCYVPLSQDGRTLAPSEALGGDIPALGAYLARVPADPSRKGQEAIDDTGYFIHFNDEIGRVTVGACLSEPEGRGGSGDPVPILLSR